MAKRKAKSTNSVTIIIIAIIVLISVFGGKYLVDNNGIVYDGSSSSVSSEEMLVSFIDVGQGNCALFSCGDFDVLVDGGESAYSQTVVNYIRNKGIEDIECIIATHPHSDHIGSLSTVMSEFSIGDVIMPQVPKSIIPTTSTYRKFLKSVSENAENVIKAQPGETYSYGDIEIEIFAPLKDYSDLNDISVVARISYGDTSVMITGDAEKESEKDMLKNKIDYSADILNVGHHGSHTSTSQAWLEAVNPDYAVICCGADNDYGHPHKETVKRLEKYGVEYFRTDLDGTVCFVSNGKEFKKSV